VTAYSVDEATRSAVSDLVLGASGVGVVVFDADLRYVLVNEVAAEINGAPAAGHLGRHVSEILPELAPALVPVFERVLRSGEPVFGGELTGETPAQPGTERIWLVNSIPLPDAAGMPGIAVVFSEVTDLRRAERRLHTVMDSLFTFVGLLDPDGTLLEANRAALAASGLEPADVIGRPFTEAYWWSHDAAVRDRLAEAIRRAREGSRSRFDVEARIGPTDRIVLDFQLVPLVEDGVVTALVPSAIDITQRMAVTAQTAALAALAGQVNRATTPDAVASASAAGAAATVGASFATVALADERTRRLVLWHQPGTPRDVAEAWSEMPLSGTTPIQEAIATGAMVVVGDADDRRQRTPDAASAMAQLGLGTTIAVPLRRSDEVVVGAIGIGWPSSQPPDQRVADQLRTVADLVAQGVERAQLAELRHRLVLELHDQLLRPPPEIAGLDIAVRYRPATAALGFGGDWYDVVEIPSGATALVIGDVVGHGVEAAARMATLRGLLRTLLRQDVAAEHLPFRVDELLDEEARGFAATAVVAILDAARREVRYVRLGHPPLLLRRADGTVEQLTGGHQPGIGVAPGLSTVGSAPVEPGDTLVLYTDGLVERPREHLEESIARAGDVLAGVASRRADAIADDLTSLLRAEHQQRDDAVIAVCTVER
jgi:PAS domain S-box-containing protein